MYYILYLNLKTKPHTIEGCSFSVWGWGRTGGRGALIKYCPGPLLTRRGPDDDCHQQSRPSTKQSLKPNGMEAHRSTTSNGINAE